MKLQFFAFLFCLMSIARIGAQDLLYYNTYEWEEAPQLNDLEGKNSFLLHDHRIIEFTDKIYQTVYKSIWVNDDNTLESFNKVFIRIPQGGELVRIDARTIKPDGEILAFNEDNIKEMTNLEEYGNFKIFAIEGAEIGSLVEYIYALSSPPEFGGSEIIQEEIPIADAQFILRAPRDLEFEVKTYNGLAKAKKRFNGPFIDWRSETENLAPIYEELYAASLANQAKASYRLKYNKSRKGFENVEIMSWEMVANRFRELAFVEAPENSKKLFKNLKLARMKSEEEKIKAIDIFIKNNIAVRPDAGREATDITNVLERKYTTELGMLRLYASLLREAEIPFELVITSNRYKAKLDPEFPDFNVLDELLIYFPQHQTYINPDRVEYRYGFPNINAINNNGLFLTPDNYRIDEIKLPAAEESMIIHESTLRFSDDMNKATIDKFNSWTGYDAFIMRAIYKFRGEDDRAIVTTDRVSSGIEDAIVSDFKADNIDVDDSADAKPLEYRSIIETSSLIENAGNLYLINIGQIIGPQAELYQERERSNPIEMEYPKTYVHKIEFEVPKGYKVQGLEDGNFIKKCEVDGQIIAQFKSVAKEEKGKVSVEVLEFYKQVAFPKEKYEDFRSVINAAADFNKLVLVLEKE